jgi:urease accessory protein
MMRTISVVLLGLIATPALAHVGAGSVSSFGAGFDHPISGLDHVAAMVAVGLWAALKGGRAIWIWPAAFVTVMLVGGAVGMAQVEVPFVEPAILASVVALGLLVALAIDLPVWIGAAVIGAFAFFHGHAHGMEVPETATGAEYMAGFAIATALLHLAGIAFARGAAKLQWRPAIRAAGALCVLAGLAMYADFL